jgi:hypothetical protein
MFLVCKPFESNAELKFLGQTLSCFFKCVVTLLSTCYFNIQLEKILFQGSWVCKLEICTTDDYAIESIKGYFPWTQPKLTKANLIPCWLFNQWEELIPRILADFAGWVCQVWLSPWPTIINVNNANTNSNSTGAAKYKDWAFLHA